MLVHAPAVEQVGTSCYLQPQAEALNGLRHIYDGKIQAMEKTQAFKNNCSSN